MIAGFLSLMPLRQWLCVLSFAGAFSLAITTASAQQTLIGTAASWKYLDNGSDAGATWREPSFNDAAWKSGPGPLGYGRSSLGTTVTASATPGGPKFITTYFRKAFTWSGETYLDLQSIIRFDDGYIMYLNGVELHRRNLPAGAVNYLTLASNQTAESAFYTNSIPQNLLLPGENVLAVELHQAATSSSDLYLNLQVIGISQQGITRGPFLQTITPTSAIIRWRSATAIQGIVNYGTQLGSLSSQVTTSSGTEHTALVTGLQPGTKYFYTISSSLGLHAGGSQYFFRTSPTPGSSVPTRIWVLGDSGTGSADARRVRDAFYTYNGSPTPDFILMLGDNAYETGTDIEYQEGIFDAYPETLRNTALWPTLGNHDTADAVTISSSLPYLQIFNLPENAEAGGVPSGTEQYYSFNHGNIHFVCLDSQASDRRSTGPMLTWLRQDLQANNSKWLIAYWHHPPYSKGKHDSDDDWEEVQMREHAVPILEEFGVDLVLSGHSHSYERSYLQDGHYGMSTTYSPSVHRLDGGNGRIDGSGAYQKPLTPLAHQGAVYMVAGTSGRIELGGSMDHPAMFYNDTGLGSVVLEIQDDSLHVKFLTVSASIGDYFTLRKNQNAPQNRPPTQVALSQNLIAENELPGYLVGQLSTVDPDPADSHTYQLVGGSPGFAIQSNHLVTTSSFDAEITPSLPVIVRTTDLSGATYDQLLTIQVRNLAEGDAVLVSRGAGWRYLDDGSNQQTPWREVDFYDAIWSYGLAELGYGDGDETTVVSYGPDPSLKYVTTYFRKEFTVSADQAARGLMLRSKFDDGQVVYLNGIEIYRHHLPSGLIDYLTRANDDQSQENLFYQEAIPAGFLRVGRNVLAVEVHQYSRGSSDISFDLELFVFDSQLSNSQVDEGLPAGTLVGTLSTLGPTASPVYSYQIEGTAPFSISGANLLTTQPLSASLGYQVTIRATDQAGLTATKLFPITVRGVSQPPTAILLSNHQLPENLPSGTTVGTLSALDPNPSDSHLFELISDTGGLFEIVGNNLLTRGPLNFETASTHSLQIKATDSSGLSLQRELVIQVLDQNDAPSALLLSNNNISENLPAGTRVGDLTVEEEDTGDSHTFLLLTASVPFEIRDGILYTTEMLNHEAIPSYRILIRTTDRAGAFIETDFTIEVHDFQEAPASIILSNTQIQENVALGSQLGVLSIQNPVTPDPYQFELTENSYFSLQGDRLITKAPIDFETTSTIQLRLTARSTANNTSESTFLITVTDLNESPTAPILTGSTITENQPSGTVVGILTATDPDADDTQTYSLSGNSPFAISGSNLVTTRPLNFETENSFSLDIQVVDRGGLNSQQTFQILTLNQNETPTALALSSSSVAENLPSGTLIGNLTATDPDTGDTCLFTLLNSPGFRITGTQLLTDQSFDFETRPTWPVNLRVTDGGGLFFDRSFVIQILDQPEGTITITPTEATKIASQSISFAAKVSGATVTAWSWRLNGSALSTKTATHSISSVTPAHAGIYEVTAKTSKGNLIATARLTILPLQITQQPVSTTVNRGSTARFTVTATGPSLKYQWQLNGKPISGATKATLDVKNAAPNRLLKNPLS